ncbi:glycerate kinase [Parageobacillus thermoglucosidasius]|uniref:Glycerate kinase n=1 Tax=Parageobacillus thermoglucosidasius TaxID=1426 RepID=A0AB38QYI5_PARTM|nr:glycerate kinase [Parageobacillus thermoglucosidasius]MBY6269090.1 glycerate kinase [Parageobacillus thermoglucosidasius]OUM88945.1 MAG: glycerate kinase [Parageobacillus thermoglucosidasius]UOE76534.1 glycerate kinase [Parageobacillus thermoglucosidasius]
MSKTFVLAPDSFKGSMTAKEVCVAMEKGIKKVYPDANCIHVPMADGGEGTVQSLVDATDGKIFEVEVTGPLGNKVTAKYGIMGDNETAVIEMAEASGIQYVTNETKNPMVTTTYGTGELIRACLDKGIKKIIIGIGGSATNDGGAGMAEALGVKFLDRHGNQLPRGGGYLDQLSEIDISNLDPRLKEVSIFVACDVTNPLCGENGASYVFGPQKGATEEMVRILDRNLSHYADVVKKQLGKDVKNIPGAGAAGGLGAGLLIFTQATLQKGIDLVIEYSQLRSKIKDADYVFTGEGGIDFQTQYGKTPYGVAKVAKEFNKKVIAIAGHIGEGIDVLYDKGIDAIFGIIPEAGSLDKILKDGAKNVERTCENIARLIKMI